MSILKKKLSFICIGLSILSLQAIAQDDNNDILDYYQRRASEVCKEKNPLIAGVAFSFEATTYHKLYNNQKKLYIIDSLVALYYYSDGNLDSTNIIVAPNKKFESLEIQYPNIFQGEYLYNFYPNDTGGIEIAIGYDSKKIDPTIPIGIAMINRDHFSLRQLYMYYLTDKKIDRVSKYMRFVEKDDLVFPDSMWEIHSRSSIFTTEYFRTETGIYNIIIQK